MKGLGVIRAKDETWRDAVARMGRKYGKQNRCLALFDREVGCGEDEDIAALHALTEYDCVETIDAKTLVGN